jgi:hypothetical protein
MKRFVEGIDRKQSTLFPEYLDDWIDENTTTNHRGNAARGSKCQIRIH